MKPSPSELDHLVQSFDLRTNQDLLAPPRRRALRTVRDYQPVFRRVLSHVIDRSAQMRHRAASVVEGLARLADYPLSQQRLLIDNLQRFTHFEVGAALLAEADLLSLDDPWEAEEAIQITSDLTERLDSSSYPAGLVFDLQARNHWTLARCRRRRGDLSGCERALNAAETCLAEGSGDPLERIQLETERAFLLLERGRPTAAAAKLTRLRRDTRRVGGRESTDLLIALARTRRLLGRGSEALTLLDEARRGEPSPAAETVLRLGLEGVSICLESDFAFAAAALLRRLEPLETKVAQRLALKLARFRLESLETRDVPKTLATNEPCQLERWARLVLDFEELGLVLDQAHASLRHAQALARADRWPSAREAAARAMAIFDAQGLQQSSGLAQALLDSPDSTLPSPSER